MAANTLSENITLAIKNADGSSFYNLSLKKFTVDSQVMSLGDKITGDVYYKDNNLPFTMREYVEYDGVKYTLVNPPTVVKEGMVRDNSENKGMTKYSLEFYHPMYQLGNMPFNDVAVSYNESSYMSESATFSWVGYPDDYIAKLNKNLQGTQWIVVKSSNFPSSVESQISEVLPFDKESIAGALKKMYDTWELPYIVDKVGSSESSYAQGKRFKVIVGMPSAEIYEQGSQDPFVFQYGQGVGLKNNSRSPRNNKIITRIAGYGSERNIPYGYPQIVWTGNQGWNYTINNAEGMQPIEIGGQTIMAMSYPIYDGIVGGQPVKLIKHPFTRKTLMPSIYVETVYNKVNPLLPNGSANPNYNPNTEIIEYYDATAAENYPNPINLLAPSYETHEFEDIYPRLGSASIVGVVPSDKDAKTYVPFGQIDDVIDKYIDNSSSYYEKDFLWECKGMVITTGMEEINYDKNVDTHSFVFTLTHDDTFLYLEYKSNDLQNFKFTALRYGVAPPTPAWDDTMDDKGEYKQSYMEITLPVLGFDIYACASITEQMQINMRSGACIGCTFDVAVDWDDYKKNFFNADGDFVPDGAQRDLVKYPKSNVQSITVTAKKDLDTFGTLMPNRYQQPQAGDEFVILGISLPLSYIQSAEAELADAAKAYMRENNIYYFDYPLKFDEFFLHNNDHILSQIKPNAIVHFNYAGDTKDLYVKQLTTKVGYVPLPQFDITLTDNIEVSLNQIGQTVDELGKLSDVVALLRRQTEDGLLAAVMSKLSKTDDDTANGLIRFMKGLQIGRSFSSGILGSGGIIGVDADGKTYLEVDEIYARIKAVFDNVEVKNYQHSVGNRMVTKAGLKCSRVEWVGENGEYIEQNQANLSSVVSFRCFYRAKDTDDTVNNDFVAGVNEEDGKGTQDLAFCDSTNIASGVNKRSYWRAVVGKNANGTFTLDGEGWIDLSKADCRANSDIPMAGDDIIQLGNVTDKDRQGAIVEYIGGNDAPCYKIYQEIGLDERTDEEKEQGVVFNPYVLTDKCFIDFGYSRTTKRAYMNVYGDMYVGTKAGETNSTYIRYTQPHKEWVTPEPTEEVPEPEPELMTIPAKLEIKAIIDAQSTLSSASGDKTLAQIFQGIQDQLDGVIETWFYSYMPVANLESDVPLIYLPTDPEEQDPELIPCLPYYTWANADHAIRPEPLPEDFPAEVTTERDKHLGDMFYDNASGYAWRFEKDTSNDQVRFQWILISDSAVVEALRQASEAKNLANNKRRVFTTNFTQGQANVEYDVGDLWVNATGTYQYNEGGETKTVTYNNDILRCKVAKPIKNAQGEITDGNFSITDWELASGYTDDTKFNNYLTQVLNGVQNPDPTNPSEVVAQAMHALKGALNENTTIDGGLILTSLIALKNGSYVWSGISGRYDDWTETHALGHGIAAWYGGAMADMGTMTDAQKTAWDALTDEQKIASNTWAKSLFRFDGSGYFASNSIRWTADGKVYLSNIHSESGQAVDDYFFEAFGIGVDGQTRYINPAYTFSDIDIVRRSGNTYTITGNSVLNRNENDARYLLLDKFFSLFDIYNGSTNYTNTFRTSGLPQDTSNISIKAKFGFWTDQFLSALGKNDSGGGELQLNEPLASINNAGLASHPSSSGQTIVWNGTAWVYGTAGGSGTVTGVKVGDVSYSPVNGIVSLPAYPSSMAWSAITEKPTTLGGYGITDAKIVGGTITLGNNSITPLTDHQTLYTLSVYGNTTKVLDFKPNANASLYIKAGGDISLATDTENKYITLSYTHPTDGADTTIAAENGKVLSSITVDSLGHVTSVSSKTLSAADIPNLAASKITSGTFDTARIPSLGIAKITGLQTALDSKLDKAFFHNLFRAHKTVNNQDVVIEANGDLTDAESIEAMFGFWTEQYLSALGKNSSGGGGGVGDVTWEALAAQATDGRTIHSSYITDALSGYATKSWVTDNFNKYVLPAATANELGGIKVGYTTSGKNYKVQLDANSNAYVNVPWEGTTYSNGTGLTLTGNVFSITEANVSTILNLLSEGTSNAEADDYLIAQYAGGGTTTITYHRRKVSNVVNSTIVKAALGVGTGTSKYLREDGTWATPVDNNTTDKLTVNGTTNGDSVNGVNLGSLYAIATSDATLASQVWMRNANNTGYAWRQLGTRAFDSTSYLPLAGGTLTGNLTTTNIIVPSGNTIKIGDAYLVWDNANNAIKVYKLNGSTEVAVNFYATGGVSALGMSDSGGGGGVGDVTWEALAGNTNEQINASHLTTALSGYATQSWVTSRGYITSYTDTKNTAGSTNLASKKLFIIGAQSQDANPQTYSYVNCFIGTDGCLYSNGTKVLTSYTEQYTGTVTSIGITVPTGFSVTPATITTNGTFAITYANGYEGFTTALKSKISKLDDMFTLEGSGTSSDPYIIKANYGLYTDYFLSALGLNSSGGGGVSSTLEDLLDVEFAGTPSNGQVLKYNSSTGKWYNGNDNNTGTVTSIKVGTTSYNPSNGVVSLPAYPTTLPASDVSAWAKAATKPSYTLDEVSDGTTRKLSNYLPLSGGTMTGVLTLLGSQYNAYDTGVGALDLNNSDITGVNSILTADLSNTWKESIGFKRTNGNYDTFRAADGTFYFGVNNGTEYTAIHSGNWSSYIGTSSSPVAYAVSASVCTGNAATATKLATARSLWGNSFDGSADITGDFSSRGDIYARGNYGGFMLARGLASNEAVRIEALDANGDWASQGLTLMQNGNIGIGTNTPSTKLDVIGDIKATKFYFTDSVYLEYSSTNGVHLVGAGFYTDYFVSALGLNNSGSGGGDVSSVCGYIGDVTATQIGSALTSAGYSLTDTNTWRPITDSYNVTSPSSSTSLSQAGAKALYTAITGGYLPLTGGTLSKASGTPLTIKNTSSAGVTAYINFADVNGNSLGKIGADSGVPKFVSGDGAHTYTIYHSGNLTSLPASDVYAWAKAATKPSYNLDEVSDGTTRKLANYLPLSGGTLTGLLTVSSTGSERATIHLVSAADVPNDFYFGSHGVRHWSLTSRSSGDGHKFFLYNTFNDSHALTFYNDSSAVFANSVTAPNFIRSNGTSSQFLKADGSVDSNSYALTSSLGNYLPLTGGTMTGILYLSGSAYISFAPTGDIHDDYPLWRNDSDGGLYYGADKLVVLTDLFSYATQDWVTNQGYITSSGSCNYATTAGSAPASDVYSWAKAASKPSYSLSELSNVNILNVADGNVLTYKANVGWVNLAPSGGGSGTVTSIATGTGLTGGTITTSGTISINSTYQTYISHGNTAYGWGNHANAGYMGSSGGTINGLLSINGMNNSNARATLELISYYNQPVDLKLGCSNTGIWSINSRDSSSNYDFTLYCYSAASYVFRCHTNLSTEFYSSVTATSFVNSSDVRKKDIRDYNAVTDVYSIANAPAVRFTWKDGADKDLHRGTIAQYWKTVMPECVTSNNEGYLSMQYDVIALLAAISVAKKVVNHEERITELERENERLRNEINELKAV